MITLFSSNCPKCKILEKQLNGANIPFEINSDLKEVMDKGYRSLPILKLEIGEYLEFNDAIKYIIGRR